MFKECSLLKDITPLKNWNVKNCNNFVWMFHGCSNLLNINSLQFWNISNKNSLI